MAVTELLTRADEEQAGLLPCAVALAASAAGADFTGLALFDLAGRATMMAAYRHRTEAWAHLTIGVGDGLASRVLHSGRPVQVTDYERESASSARLVDVVCRGEGAGGMAAVPIRADERIFGVLYAGMRRPGPLGRGIDGLAQVAWLVGAAIGNSARSAPTPRAETSELPTRPVLSAREREILRLYAEGLSTREIAAAEFLAVNTIRSYTQSALCKLGSSHRLQAVAVAKRLGLI